jgi:hypothetical protein
MLTLFRVILTTEKGKNMIRHKNFAYVESVSPSEEMFTATISLKTHGECVVAIGSDVDECIRRAIIICDALIADHQKKPA